MTPPPSRPHYMMSQAEEQRIFYQGLRLFNDHRDFFEAHETWEDIWHISSGHRRRCYQGLIQIAVTLVHLQRDNRLGAERVRESAHKRLAGLPAVYMGINVESLLASFDRLVLPAIDKRRPPGPLFDVDRLFTIDMLYDPFDDPRPTDLE